MPVLPCASTARPSPLPPAAAPPQTLHTVLPDHADYIQNEPNRPALGATLTEAQQARHDPTVLLKDPPMT